MHGRVPRRHRCPAWLPHVAGLQAAGAAGGQQATISSPRDGLRLGKSSTSSHLYRANAPTCRQSQKLSRRWEYGGIIAKICSTARPLRHSVPHGRDVGPTWHGTGDGHQHVPASWPGYYRSLQNLFSHQSNPVRRREDTRQRKPQLCSQALEIRIRSFRPQSSTLTSAQLDMPAKLEPRLACSH